MNIYLEISREEKYKYQTLKAKHAGDDSTIRCITDVTSLKPTVELPLGTIRLEQRDRVAFVFPTHRQCPNQSYQSRHQYYSDHEQDLLCLFLFTFKYK